VRDLKGMQVVIGSALARRVAPMHEPGALFEGRVALSDELRFVDADTPQCFADRRKGPLADAQDADIRGLDQRDRYPSRRLRRECARQITRGDPTSRAAADNQHSPHRGWPVRRCNGLSRTSAAECDIGGGYRSDQKLYRTLKLARLSDTNQLRT